MANDVAGFIHSWPENTMKTAKSISLDQFVDKQSSNVSQHTKSCVFKQRFEARGRFHTSYLLFVFVQIFLVFVPEHTSCSS